MEIKEMNEDEIIVIRTLECDLCLRFDSIMLSKSEIDHRVKANSLDIGSHLITHNDHLRIVYFDRSGEYLGDTISLNVSNKVETASIMAIQPLPKFQSRKIKRIHRYLQKKFLNSSLSLCIVGPSFAGKTSLSSYLESGIPERYSKRVNHPPTMGKSIKRVELGKSNLIIYDMGGQKDFWSGWEESIEDADKIIFVIDGSAHNLDEIRESLDVILKNRHPSKKILILNNKMDLFIDGYINSFIDSNEIITEDLASEVSNIWILEASVYNGICYNYGGIREEVTLSLAISNFLDF